MALDFGASWRPQRDEDRPAERDRSADDERLREGVQEGGLGIDDEAMARQAQTCADITDDQPETRAVLVGAHVVGIALARCVVLVEPLASLTAAEVVELVAPTFQRFLTEPLGTRRASRRRPGA